MNKIKRKKHQKSYNHVYIETLNVIDRTNFNFSLKFSTKWEIRLNGHI
jgi:hypothetical protein